MQINSTQKMVINTCSGGFNLSLAAAQEIARRKGIILHVMNPNSFYVNNGESIQDAYGRMDVDLVAVVQEMGPAASGMGARLKAVDVSVTIEIEDSFGLETVVVTGCAY